MGNKRYLVFVSATYEDLKVERQKVIEVLLRLQCFPATMEFVTAEDSDPWSAMTKLIDDCDYHIVIVAGKYGSLGPDDLSYTEMEYDYADKTGKPILVFLHANPGQIELSKCEEDPKKKKLLDQFREKLKGRMYDSWDSPDGLANKVGTAMPNLFRDKPSLGWVRAEAVGEQEVPEAVGNGKSSPFLRDVLARPLGADSLIEYTRLRFPDLPTDEALTRKLLSQLTPGRYETVSDVHVAVERAMPAISAYRRQDPGLFKKGTDFLTKGLGFVDRDFRKAHHFAPQTRDAFLEHSRLVIP